MKLFRRAVGYGPFAVAAALGLDCWTVHAAPPVGKAVVPVNTSAAVGVFDDVESSTNVQVAWLADPGLYLCTLTARPTSKGMEIHGFVGNEPARQKALAIARSLYSGPVIDLLHIHEGVPIQISRGVAPAELAPVASSILADVMGDKVLNLRVVCPSPGRVEVTGTVPTLEDKLAVSKCMKSLSGCTHVVNRISAPGSPAGAAIVANIPLMMTKPAVDSSVGWKSVTESTAVVQRPTKSQSTPKTDAVAALPRPVVTAPVKNPYAKSDKTIYFDQKPGYASVTDSKSIDMTGKSKPDLSWAAAPPLVIESKQANLKSLELTKATSPPAATFNPVVPKPEQPQPPLVMPPAPELPPIDWKCDGKDTRCDVAKCDVPTATSPIIVPPIVPATNSPIPDSANSTVALPVPAPAEMPKPVDLPPTVEMPQPIIECPTVVSGKATVTDLTKSEISAEELPKPAAAPPVVATKQPVEPTVAKTERYIAQKAEVKSPVKIVTYAPEPGGMKSGNDPLGITLDAETARRAVEDVCRGAGTDLKVSAGQDRKITVAIKLTSQGEWDRLLARVQTLPEINGYSIVYNASVEGSESKPVSTPKAITRTSASTAVSSAPMMGVLRNNIQSSQTPSPEAAKAAIEKLCEEKGVELSVRIPAGKQVAVTMKVSCASDWESLYAKIKALPEIAGCSIIYNVTVK